MAWILKRLNAYKNVVFHSTNDQETKEIAKYLGGGEFLIDNNPSSTIPQNLGPAKNPAAKPVPRKPRIHKNPHLAGEFDYYSSLNKFSLLQYSTGN